jgi:molybdopterin-containing oxidoreductase family membrane subunit
MLLAVVPIRAAYRLHNLITDRHLHNLGKLLLAMSLLVGYGYASLVFMNWYSGDRYNWSQSLIRVVGPFAPPYWLMIVCNVLVPQVLWSRRLRTHPVALWVVGLIGIVGMWIDRYLLVVSSQTRDFLPSSWGPYAPTVWDWALFAGSVGLFLALGFLYLRLIPVMPVYEMRELVPEMAGHVPPEGEPA